MAKTNKTITNSDIQFVEQLEEFSLPKGSLTHIAHFRLAWVYLCKLDFKNATEKIEGIFNEYDKKLGNGTKFNTTITRAYMYVIFDRYQHSNNNSWEEFKANNTDLFGPVNEVLGQYYSQERLYSGDARVSFIEPDIKQLPIIT